MAKLGARFGTSFKGKMRDSDSGTLCLGASCERGIAVCLGTAMSRHKRRCDEKQLSGDAIRKLLSENISDDRSAEIAVLHLMEEHRFSLSALREDTLRLAFSKPTFQEMADLVGLNPDKEVEFIPTFELHRSRIPTPLFKSILEDMDIQLLQYGPLNKHTNEEATSRFTSPIFNRLVALFGFALQNQPEIRMQGPKTTSGTIEYYFKSFGAIAVLVAEVKFKITGQNERLDAIAQIIAACDACNFKNVGKELAVPVYAVLADGGSFQFFRFDGKTTPYTFRRGTLPGDPAAVRLGFDIGDHSRMENPLPFICALRPICEMIFDILLEGYILSLQAYYDRSLKRASEAARPRPSTGEWEKALALVRDALTKFRGAEAGRNENRLDEADQLVQNAMQLLQDSVDTVPDVLKPPLIMSGWNEEEVRRV